MVCKVHDGKLVVYSAAGADASKAVITIPKKGGMYSPTSYSFKESSSKTGYKGAKVAYTDSTTGTTHTAEVAAPGADATDEKMLQLNKRVESERDAMAGGELPSEDILAAVRAAVSADDVRPLTDTVTVQAPEIVPYEVQITWYLSRSQEPLLSTIQAKVLAAVEQYRLWQRAKPGRDILPLKLSSLIEQAGARRIDME